MRKEYSFDVLTAQLAEMQKERSEWEAEWRNITDYLIPGRGIYQTYSRPRKRKLTSPKIINSTGSDALEFLVAEMHGRLTSPARQWFKLSWANEDASKIQQLKLWMEEAYKRLNNALHESNFYQVIHSFYVEHTGFATAAMFVGEDGASDSAPFRFEIMTAGEYYIAVNSRGMIDTFFRTLMMSPRQIAERWGESKLAPGTKQKVTQAADKDTPDIPVLEAVLPIAFNSEQKFTRVFYELTALNPQLGETTRTPLQIEGFYEMPYLVSRWEIIGSDVYGVGPGSRSLQDIKRLQEMEKAFLMATHKTVNPPLNAPSRLKNKLQTLPGGKNYYSNPAEVIEEIYKVKFDFQGVSAAVERVEQRIKKTFFNDVFLTANRDPNATPYKATEVNARDRERLLRLGPVVERLQFEFFSPLIQRAFNIMLRKGLFPPMVSGYERLTRSYDIRLISPLALAQKQAGMNSVMDFLGFLGQAVNVSQEALDNVNIDRTTREVHDMSGAPEAMLNSLDEVEQIRKARAEAMAAKQQEEKQIQDAMIKAELEKQRSESLANRAKAGEQMATTATIQETLQ